MTNEQMTSNRYGRWATARKAYAEITAALQAGKTIIISTYCKAWQFDQRHTDFFKATKSGLYMRRGKHWDCIDGASVRIYS